MKKVHWTQTDEGRKKMSEIQNKIRVLKNGKRKYTKRANGLVIRIEGKDAGQALTELISNVEYDKLRVRIIVERQ